MIITFTNVIGAIRNAISFVITTNLKMWLGFETSETIGKNIYDGGIIFGANGGTFTDNGNGTFTVTGDGSPNLGIGVRDFDADYLTVGDTYKFSTQGANTTVAVYNSSFSLLTSGINSVEFQATTSSIKLYILPTNGVSATYSDVEVRKITQITPDKSGNNNVGELFTGKALDFDGNNDYVDVDGFKMSGNTATFSFWINPTTIGSNNQHIIDIDPNRFIIGFNNSQLSLYSPSSWHNFGSISTDVYQKVTIVINNTNVKCYVNGVQLGVDKTITSINLSSATKFKICSHLLAASNFVDCKLSNLQIYNSAWSADDIAYDYANPNKLAIDNPSTNLVVTNLKGYWALSEGDGLVAYDSGTNLEEEEVVDGDFPTDTTAWTKLIPSGQVVEFVNNQLHINYDASEAQGTTGVRQSILTPGKTYEISIDIQSITRTLTVLAGGVSNNFDTIGVKTFTVTPTTNALLQIINPFGAGQTNNMECYINSVSVREVTASDHGGIINGADYVDAQPRIPQLGMQNWSKGSNLVTYSEEFDNTAWTQVGTINVTANNIASPSGSITADKIEALGTTSFISNIINGVDATQYTSSVFVKNIDSVNTSISIRHTITALSSVLNWSGSVLDSITNNTGVSTFTDEGNGWYRITSSYLSVEATQRTRYNPSSGTANKSIYLWGAQLEQSATVGNYRLTYGAATSNSIVIANPTIPTKDIFGNAVRDRLNSFNLDGTGYSSVANNSSIKPTSALSIECWVKTPDVSSASKYISDADVGTTRFFLMQVGSKARFKIATAEIDSATNLTNNSWHYIAGTWDGTTMTLYVDEDTPVTISKSGAITYNTDDLFIGSRLGTGEYFDGLISDVRLYDRALTSDEIENNYNAGLSAHTN